MTYSLPLFISLSRYLSNEHKIADALKQLNQPRECQTEGKLPFEVALVAYPIE